MSTWDINITAPGKKFGDVADQAAMLAVTGIEPTQWVHRLDADTAWQYQGTDPSVLANWKEWPYPVVPSDLGSAAYANATDFDAAGAASSAVSSHVAAADPHGDRAYTDSKVAQEVTDRNAAIAAALVGLWDDRGNFDASGADAYPTTGGSGTGGAILKGDVWTVSAAGHGLDLGDTVRALVDSPGLTASNWAAGEANVQQATESLRGTAKVVAQATIEDSSTTNDTDMVTAKKWWQGWAKGLMQLAFLQAVQNTVLSSYAVGSNAEITNADKIKSAFGKVQGQLNALRQEEVHITIPGVLLDGDVPLALTLRHAGQVDSLTHKLGGGTCKLTLKLDGTAITSINAVDAGTTEVTSTATGANTYAAGTTLLLTIGSCSSAKGLQLSIYMTRTL